MCTNERKRVQLFSIKNHVYKKSRLEMFSISRSISNVLILICQLENYWSLRPFVSLPENVNDKNSVCKQT